MLCCRPHGHVGAEAAELKLGHVKSHERVGRRNVPVLVAMHPSGAECSMALKNIPHAQTVSPRRPCSHQ